MKNFIDNAGRTWTISVNVATIKNVKSILGIDLLSVVDGQLLEKLSNDPVLLCDMLYVLCKTQCEAQGVTDEAFGMSLGGDAIESATSAFLQELIDFFPSAKRGVLSKLLGKLRTLENKALDVMNQRLDSPELEEKLNQLLSGNQSMNTPESVA